MAPVTCRSLTFALGALLVATVGACRQEERRADRLVSEWVRALHSHESTTRLNAARVFNRDIARSTVALRALLRSLARESSDIHLTVSEALSDLGLDGVVALPGLTELLGDENPSVRVQAALALGHIANSTARAIGPLTSALSDSDPDVRVAVARALGRSGPKAASAAGELTR